MAAELAPGIWTVDQPVAEGKNGVVCGTRAALALDTGNSPADGEAMRALIRSADRARTLLAYTYGHGDHILGSSAFLDVERYAHRLTPGVMRRELSALARRAGAAEVDLAAAIGWPTVTYSEALTLDLGGRTVHLFPTPGHSEDSVCAYVEPDRVLFAGDTVVTAILPAIADGDGRRMEASLRRLAGMEIEILVSGHGPPLFGVGTVRAWIEDQARYLAEARAWVRARLAAGEPPDALPDRAPFDALVRGRLPRERHRMDRRHRNVIAKLVAEVADDV